jgi:hypothetical protein
MDTEVLKSFIRQLITMAGTYAATKGYVDNETALAVGGSVFTLISVGWSYFTHKKPKDAAPK